MGGFHQGGGGCAPLPVRTGGIRPEKGAWDPDGRVCVAAFISGMGINPRRPPCRPLTTSWAVFAPVDRINASLDGFHHERENLSVPAAINRSRPHGRHLPRKPDGRRCGRLLADGPYRPLPPGTGRYGPHRIRCHIPGSN